MTTYDIQRTKEVIYSNVQTDYMISFLVNISHELAHIMGVYDFLDQATDFEQC